jgi:hypothetical protein
MKNWKTRTYFNFLECLSLVSCCSVNTAKSVEHYKMRIQGTLQYPICDIIRTALSYFSVISSGIS